MLGQQQVEAPKEGVGVRGCFRINIMEDGKLVGDSGWMENQVVNLGFNWYLAALLGGTTGSLQVGFMALGSGTQPGAANTDLEGEVEERTSVAAATSSGSKTVRFTATFGSSDSFVTDTQNISNVGLFALSAAGSIFAGNTYASSSCATNQDVNCTYDIIFS